MLNFLIRHECKYLPKYQFSSSTNGPARATITTIKGLKAETNKGPLMCTHHATIVNNTPVANNPCTYVKIVLKNFILVNVII